MGASYKPLPAAEELWELFSYNPLTGQLHCRKTGKIRGWRTRRGYRRVVVAHNKFLAHRLIWKWITGFEPRGCLDHIDGDGQNNRFLNLRQATHSQNSCNRGKDTSNTSGFKGVFRNRDRWTAKVMAQGTIHRLGTFDTPEEAHQAYCEAARRLHREFAQVA